MFGVCDARMLTSWMEEVVKIIKLNSGRLINLDKILHVEDGDPDRIIVFEGGIGVIIDKDEYVELWTRINDAQIIAAEYDSIVRPM